jgi:hypothetical protein
MNDTWKRTAEDRVTAADEGREPLYEFPAGEIAPQGPYDVALDTHTASGSGRDRGYEHFLIHSSRTDSMSELEKKFKRANMALVEQADDLDATFSETEYDHALSTTDPETRWEEPDFTQKTLDSE